MTTDLHDKFSEQFMQITNKLKKRFMRKPNVNEAKNEFIALAIQCEHSEQPTFAGQCYISAAKCDATIGNFLGEADSYLLAARQFIKAEMKLSSLKCSSPARENLEAGIGCYIQALNKFPQGSQLQTSVMMEVARNLTTLEHELEAIEYYKNIVDSIDGALRVRCIMTLIELYIKNEQYGQALSLCNSICDMEPKRIAHNVLLELEITRILLVLLEKPATELIPTSLSQLIDDVRDEDLFETELFNTELKMLLQSIIISYETEDIEALIALSSKEIKSYLTSLQQNIMKIIIKNITYHY